MAAANEQFRAAQQRTASLAHPDECLSRQELVELVNAWIWEHHNKKFALAANYIGKLEQGVIRWPGALCREAFRAIFGGSNDAALGFINARSRRAAVKLKDRPTMTAPSTQGTHQAAGLRHALAATLADEGAITSPRWRKAFAMVPRHLFTPRFFLHADEGGYRAVDSGDPEWLALVYSDRTLVTQLDGDDSARHRIRKAGPAPGRASSSST
jgi:hypothetical protein